MKTSLLIFAGWIGFIFGLHASEIPEISMASGRSLKKVQIIDVTAKGIVAKHAGGKGFIEFAAFTKEGILQAGGADLWSPAPVPEKGKMREPGDITRARAVLSSDLKKLPTETKASHTERVRSSVIVLDTEAKQALAQYKALMKKRTRKTGKE